MSATRRAAVVGAGLGGLGAALTLAAEGWSVTVFEGASGPGGKADVATVDGVTFDTGPSVLTLPEVFDAIFRRAGSALDREVTLRAPKPSFRYLYPDGARVDVYPTADETLAHLRDTLGRDAVDDLASFLAYAREIWNAAAPRFVFGPAPSLSALASRGAFGALLSIDPLHTMRGGIDRRVRSPHLRALLYRYATYNGSDVRRAPATLNCIAHVELSLGGFGVEGGIHALITAMVRRAEALGVEFRYGTPVRSIRVRDGRARGVVTDGGSHDVDAVVSNADVAHLVTELLPRDARGGVSPPDDPSLSGWTAVARARRTGDRVAHTVVFPKEYLTEFRDLFDLDDAPSDPTVYLCAQEACHGRAGWSDGEPVFLMANAPAGWSGDVAGLRARVLARAVSAGLLRDDDPVVWSRTPAELAARFPGSQGSLYGASSNTSTSAFRRAPNRWRGVRGLYAASGTAHPGGGMPLCAQSGVLAAQCAMEDFER